jgi:hypothetical protein
LDGDTGDGWRLVELGVARVHAGTDLPLALGSSLQSRQAQRPTSPARVPP